jgi:hypothetical protein
MDKISTYPQTFKIRGDTFELHKNMVRKVDAQGIEGKLSLVGDVIGAAVSESADEYAVAVQYKEGVYCISKKSGWFGPFDKVQDVVVDEAKGVAVVDGTLKGKAGKYPLQKK